MSMKSTPSSTARRNTRQRLVVIGRVAPDALAGDPHRTEAEPADGEVAADVDRSGPGRDRRVVISHCVSPPSGRSHVLGCSLPNVSAPALHGSGMAAGDRVLNDRMTESASTPSTSITLERRSRRRRSAGPSSTSPSSPMGRLRRAPWPTTTALARRADELGFDRFWVAEHHNFPTIASTSPPVLMAHLAASTSRIRIGSGGVMLPNHPALVVAEQFALLEALHPGRIDLGIGRAPGTDPATAAALRRSPHGLGAEDFPNELIDLMGLLGDRRRDHGAWDRFRATPAADVDAGDRPARVERVLGPAGRSARTALRVRPPLRRRHVDQHARRRRPSTASRSARRRRSTSRTRS